MNQMRRILNVAKGTTKRIRGAMLGGGGVGSMVLGGGVGFGLNSLYALRKGF